MDLEGDGGGLFEDAVSIFAWKYGGQQRKF
jgi:hypothetical protein